MAARRQNDVRRSRRASWGRGWGGLSVALLLSAQAAAQTAETAAAEKPGEPSAGSEEASGEPDSLMNLLARKDLHQLKDESWNAYLQFTYISSWHPAFHAAYTNLNGSINSLSPEAEQSFTLSFTLFLGVKLWRGAEAYVVPEVIAEKPFSQLRGLGGAIQNFELQKTGGETPQLYRSRAYVSQTFNLGGGSADKDSGAMQLAGPADRRRFVVTLGNFSALDFFDRNSFTNDTRQQFLSMSFMTYAAWDFASDARGYSWGGAAEFYFDDWALRFARISPPENPNQLPITLQLNRYYGDTLELEHQHQLFGLAGAVRVLGFRNREVMGRFADAIAAFEQDPADNAAGCTGFNYGSQNATAPDLCWARRPNVKIGIGVDIEQHITGDIGVFFRGMYSDGQTEVQAYTSTDRSINFGALGKGSAWGRPLDVAGLGGGAGFISSIHAQYLEMGGIDGFVGDGSLRQAAELNAELFYSVNLLRDFWVTGDLQRIWNPAFNADRGPLNVFGLRVHGQY